MTADFRALCVELLDCLEKADWPPRYKVVFQQWADIARTALAEPEPEEPTDEELNAICDGTPSLAEIDDLCAKHSFHYEDNDSLECLLLIITDALARWGNHRGILGSSPQPIPVSERLPRPEDCDAEGRVWLYRPQTPILNPYWDLVKMDYIDPEPPPTHWLPFNALPLPSGEVKA